MSAPPPSTLRRGCRAGAASRVPLLVQALAAGGALWLLPHGFPVSDPLFFANTCAPAVLLGASLSGYVASRRGRRGPARAALALWVGVLLGITLAALVLFPHSGPRALPLGLLGLAAASICLLAMGFGKPARLAVLLLAGALLGAQNVHARRGADPGTRPAAPQPLPRLRAKASSAPIGSRAHLDREGWLRLRLSPSEWLHLDAIPRFRSRSPDRAWTVLGGRAGHVRIGLPLEGRWERSDAIQAQFGGDHPAELRLSTRGLQTFEIDARRTLSAPIYSHLNHSFAFSLESDPGEWWLRFGGGERVQVVPRGYPVGRPARFAVLRRQSEGGAHVLEVLEARSAEKGPFKPLARVDLPRDELAIEVSRANRVVFRIDLLEWCAQASTQRSPTAGYGLPENALEFWTSDGGQNLWFSASWAASSVGRGWDSVGHAPGTYRNHLRVTLGP